MRDIASWVLPMGKRHDLVALERGPQALLEEETLDEAAIQALAGDLVVGVG